VLVGTSQGAAIVEGGELRVLTNVKGRERLRGVWSVAVTEDDGLWFGTSRGLWHRDPDGLWRSYTMASGHLDDDWVTSVAVGEGTVWVGTYAAGVSRLRPSASRPGGYAAAQLGGGRINPGGVTVAEGTVWVSTMQGLLTRRVDKGGPWTRMNPLPGQDVTSVRLADDRVWVTTRSGLVSYPARDISPQDQAQASRGDVN
jgi:ligand-binding sensor domain-containing protein